MPFRIMESEDYEIFLKRFNINHLRTEWEKFEYEDHQKMLDKIIFPSELYWNDLFKSNWKSLVRKSYGWFLPKSFFGTINSHYSIDNERPE